MNQRLGPALAFAAAVLLVGCGRLAGPPDDLSTWQPVPLAADPELSGFAANFNSCRVGAEDGVPIEVLLQDRRTEWTAAFLVRGPETFGSCMYSGRGGGGGGSSQPAAQLGAFGHISVDEDGSGGLGGGTATIMGGRVTRDVFAVRVVVTGGLEVEASVGGGYWLAWWPGEVRASRVVPLDASRADLPGMFLSTEGWAAE